MNKRRSMVVTITICTLLIFVLISSTAWLNRVRRVSLCRIQAT